MLDRLAAERGRARSGTRGRCSLCDTTFGHIIINVSPGYFLGVAILEACIMALHMSVKACCSIGSLTPL